MPTLQQETVYIAARLMLLGRTSALLWHVSQNTRVLNVCAWMSRYYKQDAFLTDSTWHRWHWSWTTKRVSINCAGETGIILHFPRQYRFFAYRQFTSWCWGWLGRKVRVVLPSCVVTKVRAKFPSKAYTGFKYPPVPTSTSAVEPSPRQFWYVHPSYPYNTIYSHLCSCTTK